MNTSLNVVLSQRSVANWTATSTAAPTELLVIDAGITEPTTLAIASHPTIQVLMLDAEQDGVLQIGQLLRSHPTLHKLHIFAHGIPGAITLGNATLNPQTIHRYHQELATWFIHATTPQIQIYSCQVAKGAVGALFLESLHQITQASIAAATDYLGQTTSGHNWSLDYQLGTVEINHPIAPEVLATYVGVLAPPVITDALTTVRTTAEDTALNITGISIADADSPTQTVTVSITMGAIALAPSSGVTITGTTSSSITFTGTIAQVNAALNGMTYTPITNDSGTETLTVTTNDGSGPVTQAIPLNVTPVNDVPIMSPSAASFAEGSVSNFAASNFGITDVDSLPVQIIVKLSSLPTKGYLSYNGSRLVVGSTFSSDQIAQLKYHHDGTQTTAPGGTSDSFQVTVDDGAGGAIAATTIPITITPINQAPVVSGSTPVFEGELNRPVTISIADLDQTAGNAYNIKITSLPTDGILKFNGTAVTLNQTISSNDLANLTYSHNGNDTGFGNPPNDSFNVQVFDDGGGTGTPLSTTASITLNVRPNNDDPTLTNNLGLNLNTQTEGLTKVITAADLKVTDPDSVSAQLTYKLKQLPDDAVGTIQKFNGSTWVKLGVDATFTQEDIDNNQIRYSFHKSTTAGQSFLDSFKFEVQDSEIREYPTVREGGIWNTGGTALDIITFNINISTPTPSGGPGGTQTPDVGNNANPTTITNTGFANLPEGNTITITKAMLETIDLDNTAVQLVYRVEASPTSGTIVVGGIAIGQYGSFTQDDINQNRVQFVHQGDEDFIDDFKFTVSDGKNILAQQTFTIDITPQNDSPVVTVNGSPILPEGGTVNITNAHIALSDVDGSGEKTGTGYATVNTLDFKVTTLPTHGILQVDQGSGYVTVTTGTIITKEQLDGNKLRYVHGGTENFADSFFVQANDNTTGTSNNLSTIQKIDIEIASLNDAPSLQTPVKFLTVAEGATGTIKGTNGTALDEPRLIYVDPDNSAIQRQFRITTPTAFGKILLNGKALAAGSVFTQADLDNNRITYKHDGTENYADTFSFEVSDGAAPPVPGSYSISITPTNDSPTLAVPTTQTFATTTPLTFNTANGNRITFDDPDLVTLNVGETDIVRITLDLQATSATYAGSTLTLGSTTGVTVLSGSNGAAGGKLVIEGTKANIQAALDGLQVQVPTDEDRGLSLVVTVDDRNNGGPDAPIPQPTTVTKTININASNVNDVPTIPTAPNSVTAIEDTAFSFTGANAIAISDVDTFDSTNNSVTLTVTKGKLNLTPGTASISGGSNNSTTITLTGSLAAINTAIATLTYTGDTDFNGSDNLKVTFNDAGNLGTGGAQTVIRNIPIAVTPVNDAPTLAAPSATLAISDGNPIAFSGANLISIDDAKDLGSNGNGLDTFTVVVNALNGAAPYGSIQAATGSGAEITGDNSSSVTISGTKAQVNAALNGLSYTPADSNVDVTISLNVTVKDQANGGTAIMGTGGELTATKTVLINVSGTNDAPVLTAPTSITATEDTDYTFAANAIQLADPDDFGGELQVQLTVAQGKLTLASLTGITIVSGSNTSATMTIKGTEANLQAALNGLKYRGDANSNNTAATKDTLSVVFNDLGNTGTGGAKQDTKTIDIIVNPQNDAPIATGSATVTAVLEDTTNPTGSNIGTLLASNYSDITDTVTGGSTATPLAGIAVIANAATAAQGTWQYFDGASWTTIPRTGLSNTTALVISATADLRFLPAANFNGTPGSLTVRLSDGTLFTAGSSQNVSVNGGTSGWSAATVAIATSITAVNDAPVASGSASLTAVNEDTTNPTGATVSTLFTPRFSDTTDTITGGSTAHTLAGVAIVGNAATSAQGTWQYLDGSTWVDVGAPTSSAGLVIAQGTQLRFLPSANFNGTPGGLTVHLIDSSGGVVTTGNTVDLSAAGAIGGITTYSATTVPLNTSITAVNDPPSGADNTKTIDEDTSYTFAASDFGFTNPADPSDTFNGIKVSTLPTDGKLQLNGVNVTSNEVISLSDITSGKLKFVPDANENGTSYSNFTFAVRDNSGAAATEYDPTPNTFTFNVTPVNDPPTGADKTISTNEDTAYTLAIADFGFSDADGHTLTDVRIDVVPTKGTLKLDGVDVTAGTVVTAADITAGKLVFTPATNANGTGYANFDFSVKDSSGEFDLAPNKITINVVAVNDPPTGADKTISTNEDTAYTLAIADFGFSDLDGHTLTDVRIDTIPTKGTLKLNGVDITAVTVVTATDITAGKLVFTPAANANGTGYANFDFSVKDSSGEFDLAPNKITIDVVAVNDPPAGADKTVSTNEDTAYTLAIADFGFSDADGHTLTDVRIDVVPTKGTLKLDGVDVTAGTVVTAADITAGKLVFTPAADANGTGYANFDFSVKDSSGEFDPSPNKITIDVVAVNDPPTGADKTVSTNEDTAYTLAIADFGFSDADGHTLTDVRIDVVPTKGTLKLDGVDVTAGTVVTAADITAGKLVFTPAADANGTGYANFNFSVKDSSGEFDLAPNTITFNVTAVNDAPTGQDKAIATTEDTGYVLTTADFGFSDIDPGDTLAGVRIDTIPASGTFKLNGVAVTPGQVISAADIAAGKLVFIAAANSNGNNNASFTFSVKDSSGNSATEFDTVPNTISFNVAPTNDPPTGTDKTLTTTEDTGYPLTVADFGFSDIDPGDTLSGVRIDTLPNGTLKLNGTTVTAGQVIAVAEITAGNLVFTPAPNSTSSDTFTFSVKDSSGDVLTQFDTVPNTITVTVTPANDPPNGQDKTIPTVGGTPYTFAIADFGFTDIDPSDSLSGVRIDTLPTSGTFKLNGVDVTPGQVITAADIAAGKLVFTAAVNAPGSNAFTFSVRDSSGNSSTEFDPVPNTISLSVSDRNDPPTGQNKTIATPEDTGYPLAIADFGFSDLDPGDTLSGVRIDTIPNGTLKLNGVNVTPGQVISATDIAAGKLVFTPGQNFNGNDTFNFSVRDSSGEAATEFDTTPNSLTFTVTPVNDPPTGQDKAIATAQNVSYSFSPSDFGFSDVDPGDTLSGVRIDTLPTNGTFQLNGVTVTAGQVISATDLAAGKLVFTPALNANGLNYASFTFSVKDSSGSAATEFDLVPNTITISVGFTNTAPTGQDKTITTAEDTSYGLTASDFGFGDVDPGDMLSGVRVDTLPTNGTLKLNNVSVTVGQVISASDVVAGKLSFTPAPSANGTNYANFTFSVRDSSGDLATQFDTAPNTITFNVTAANDSPTGQDRAIATPEDVARPFSSADFGFSDTDPGDTFSGVRIDTLPTNGTITLNGTPITPGQIIDVSDIPNLVLTPAANATGAVEFTFSVRDSSADPASEFDPTPNKITFNVTPVKDSPTGTDKTIAATGGIGYPLTIADFGFSDPDVGDVISAVRIDTLPANGTFQLNGAAVTAGQVISATDIAAGKLVFTVAPGTNGTNYANFTFSVRDNSGDVPTEFDKVANTITFDVASNLPPTIDLDGNDNSGSSGNDYQVTFTPGQLATIGDVDVKIVDVDDLNIESATLTLTTRPSGAAESLKLTTALPNNIRATAYDPLTGTLKLTGSASIADYQAAIASIAYDNTAPGGNSSDRIVTVILNDGEKDSNIATTTIYFDSDRDGIADGVDLDDDNDGIPDAQEGSGDTDGDGIADTLDLDSDNDGISDIVEAGGVDTDNDGVLDNFVDTDRDGLGDRVDPNNGGTPLPVFDTDGDGKRDFQDRDSDNDGILDVIEAGGIDPDGDGVIGTGTPVDADQDGLPDLVDLTNGGTPGTPLPIPNTDGDAVPDYRDLDSDNDGITDVIEGGGTDPDSDGIIGSGTPVDTDGDGIADTVDPTNGGTPLPIPDGDGDRTPDYQDLDSDNDGIPDLKELGGGLPDANNDGKVDGVDADNDGLIDALDGNDTGFGSIGNPLPRPIDTNGNGIPDYREPPARQRGGAGSDEITGGNGNDILNGFSDLDILRGGDGNDIINGGSDGDTIRGDAGNDILNGGSNNDDMAGGTGNDVMNGGTGDDLMLGEDGDDLLNGGTGKDTLRGGRGNDTINGNQDNDILFGNEGQDIIRGNRGNDTIVGGAGKDKLTGGQGRDRFVYESVIDFGDTITDFEIRRDKINLKAVFQGTRGSMSKVRLRQKGDDVIVQVNVGGFKTLGVLEDVTTDTLNKRHFIF
jgi:large repetitive protein